MYKKTDSNFSDIVICGATIVTPYFVNVTNELEPMYKCFESMEQHFPHGLPQRLAGLDNGTRYLLAAVKSILRDEKKIDELNTGIAIGTFLGCSASRLNFLKSLLNKEKRVANPIYFKTTVPSVAAGAIAILCQCCGPSITCIGQSDAGLISLHNAMLLIRRGVVKEMIVGGYEDFPEEMLEHIPNRVMGKAKWKDGGAALLIRNATDALNDNDTVIGRIKCLCMRGYGVSSEDRIKALQDAMINATSNIEGQSPEFIISAGKKYYNIEQQFFPDSEIIDITDQWGETHGLSGIIKVISAIEKIKSVNKNSKNGMNHAGVLVNSIGISGTVYSAIIN